jgi:hypothetical protein
MRPLHTKRTRSKLADAHAFRKNGIYCGAGSDDYLDDAERTRIVDEAEELLLELATKRFPKTRNVEYALLKAHLIVESALTQFIRCTSFVLVDAAAISFTFAQKLEIAVLHGFGLGDPVILPAVELLNRIRNQISHRFDLDRALVHELIRISFHDIDDASALTDRQLVSSLKNLCAYIGGCTCGHMRAWIVMTEKSNPVQVSGKSP